MLLYDQASSPRPDAPALTRAALPWAAQQAPLRAARRRPARLFRMLGDVARACQRPTVMCKINCKFSIASRVRISLSLSLPLATLSLSRDRP